MFQWKKKTTGGREAFLVLDGNEWDIHLSGDANNR